MDGNVTYPPYDPPMYDDDDDQGSPSFDTDRWWFLYACAGLTLMTCFFYTLISWSLRRRSTTPSLRDDVEDDETTLETRSVTTTLKPPATP